MAYPSLTFASLHVSAFKLMVACNSLGYVCIANDIVVDEKMTHSKHTHIQVQLKIRDSLKKR